MLWLKNLLFTLVVPGTVGVYLPLFLASEGGVDGREPALWLALPFFAVGLAFYGWCVWDFAAFGRGTPLPLDAPKKLVIRGLYRYSRNPMYIGVVTVILAWAVTFESLRILAYAGGIALLFHLRVVFYEEPHLRCIFGEDYLQYCGRVGRWLPRWPG